MDKVFLGTTVKLEVTVTGAPDIDVEDCGFDVYIWTSLVNDRFQKMPGNKVIHRKKSECIIVDEETFLVEVQTPLIGKGYIIARVELHVPDTDCSGGIREEVEQSAPYIEIV